MIRRSYYTVLGVPRDESPLGIRAAYRDRARRLHPDVAGAGSAPAFREVTEAFEVLSDPERRLAYDGMLDEEAGVPARGRTAIARTPLRREPITIIGEPDGVRPSFEALRDRFERNFTGVAVPKSERAEALRRSRSSSPPPRPGAAASSPSSSLSRSAVHTAREMASVGTGVLHLRGHRLARRAAPGGDPTSPR
jgi:DnaJ-class molecular chaperone